MKIIQIDGLAPCYRAYEADNGVLVQVKVQAKDSVKGAYILTAQAIDETGEPIGPESAPHCMTVALDQSDLPEVVEEARAGKGQMVINGGRVLQHDGTELVDHGPIPDGASPALAERIVTWNRQATVMADRAAKAWKRQQADDEINQLIGETQ